MLPLIMLLLNIEVESKIDSVVLYGDRVIIARIARVYMEKTSEVVFADLPGAIDDQSVRVKAEGLTIGEVQVKTGYAKEPHPEVRELQSRIRELEISDRALNDELAVLKDKEKFLQSIAAGAADVIAKEVTTGRISPSSWDLGLKFVVNGLLDAKGRSAAIDRERIMLQEKLSALKLELDDVRALVENRKTVVFEARPKHAGNYDIELDYLVHGASWRTYYELRADPSNRKIEIDYYGKISQRTGEDWDDVRLVLSTAAPSYGGYAPAPEPWYIYRFTAAGYDDNGLLMPAAKPAERAAVLEKEEVAEQAAPAVEKGIAIWYPLPYRYSIASGAAEKKMAIADKSLAADFRFYIIPRLDPKAYLTGEMSNQTDYLFLAGDANTYVNDDFTGKSYFATVAPEESIKTFFGVDDRVKVTRELKKSGVSRGGLFSDVCRYDVVYENSVKNFHNKEITCTIIDMVPVSQDPKIKVAGIKLDPKPAQEDRDRGIYYWNVAIKPNDEFKITVAFIVDAPPEVDIQRQMY